MDRETASRLLLLPGRFRFRL